MNHLLNILSGSEEETKAIREKLGQKLVGYATGELDHAVDVISSIWEMSNKEESISGNVGQPQAPPIGGPDDSWLSPIFSFFGRSFRGCDMRSPLIESIKEGCFLDRKYWARRSREGAIEPIYFPYSAIRAELPCLNTSEWPHPGGRSSTELCSDRTPTRTQRPPQ